MAVVLGLTGFLLLGPWGLFLAMGILVFGVFFSRRASAAVILRMYKASPIDYDQAPQLLDLFNELCRRAGLQESPRLFYIPSRMPNAFAVGTGKSASVAVTDGLLRMMNSRELAGVLAHEIAHVVNGDVGVMTTADAITRTTSMISRMGLFAMVFSFGMIFSSGTLYFMLGTLVMFFAPTLVIMLQLAVSRSREFNADLGSAELTHDPAGLASALSKLDRPKPKGFLGRILNPGPRRKEPSMLRTHPPTEERVERLMELVKLAQDKQQDSRIAAAHKRVTIEGRPRVRKRPRYHVTTGIWR